jgi:glycosyltransferase involved in cell wall biosynthesis
VKVLHVIARVNLGGTARWLETLTAEQTAAGQEVVVATGHVQGDEVEDPGADTMPLVRLDRLGRAVSPLDDLWAARELRDLIGDLQPDVVNTHTAKAGLVGRAAGLSLGRRRPVLGHTVHGHLLRGYFSAAAVRGISMSERLMASASDLVLAAGQKVRDDLVAARIVSPSKVVVVRPGVRDFARLPQAQARQVLGLADLGSRPVAGWLARVVRVKRPDRLAGAAAGSPGVDYIVGGDGALRPGLEEHSPPNLRTLGWVDPPTFWSACDLAVLTSDNEAMPYSLVEAALAGLPTVTTDAGSASEVVVDGVTGLVVPLSAEAVAEGVRRLVADPDAMARMGAAARERALVEFSPQRMLAEHTAAYERAITVRG